MNTLNFEHTLNFDLAGDQAAKHLSWRLRWYIAMEIGIGIRYLHEECVDGPIADLSVCSSHIAFSEGYSAMVSPPTHAIAVIFLQEN